LRAKELEIQKQQAFLLPSQKRALIEQQQSPNQTLFTDYGKSKRSSIASLDQIKPIKSSKTTRDLFDRRDQSFTSSKDEIEESMLKSQLRSQILSIDFKQ